MIFHNNTVNCFRNLTQQEITWKKTGFSWDIQWNITANSASVTFYLSWSLSSIGSQNPCEIQTWPFRMRVNIALPSLEEFSRTCDQTDNPSFSWYTDIFKSKVYLYISDFKSIFITVSRYRINNVRLSDGLQAPLNWILEILEIEMLNICLPASSFHKAGPFHRRLGFVKPPWTANGLNQSNRVSNPHSLLQSSFCNSLSLNLLF